jgi:hypothetical protein
MTLFLANLKFKFHFIYLIILVLAFLLFLLTFDEPLFSYQFKFRLFVSISLKPYYLYNTKS